MFTNFRIGLTMALALVLTRTSNGQLELHYTFDDAANVTADSSGNGRDGELDDTGGVEWIDDDQRGGVLQFPGSTNGYVYSPIPELSGEDFTIAFWAYRDPALCCGAGGANDGLFQVEFDDGEGLVSTATKVIGGWVQKSDGGLWGRIIQEDGTLNNLDRTVYIMEDESWVHLAYRGSDGLYEVVVNGVSGDGPAVAFDGTLNPHDTIFIGRQGTETWGGRLDDFRVYSTALTDEEIQAIMAGGGGGVLGDFNGDEVLDAADIDALTLAVISGQNNVDFDLDNNNLVNDEDRRVWVEDLKNTWFGDANLDREFNSADFVLVFQAGQYEDNLAKNSTWATGDWDGNQEFDSSDFVKAFQSGGYETGPRPGVAAVPEPSSAVLLILGILASVNAGRTDRHLPWGPRRPRA